MLFYSLLLSLSAFASDHGSSSKVNGWDALSTLQTGNMRFYEGHASHPNSDLARRNLVAGGQHPHTIVVSCSDSRVPPEEIFDQGLGDIFTVRNAGNVMSVESIASIEYAIEHLGARFLVVMGHESCGAVGAAIGSVPGKSNGSPSLDTLVRGIRSHLSTNAIHSAAEDKTFRKGVKENVNASLADLVKKSDIVREAVAKKGLVLGQAIYSLSSGRVEFWDVGKTAGVPLEADSPVVIKPSEVKEEQISSDPVAVPKSKAKPKKAAVVKAPEADAHHH